MLVSHKYRFIFIKTVKTAGTSIEVELSKIMADDDIVTKIKPPVEGHVPRNFDTGGKTPLYNHMTARDVRAAIGPEMFNGYFKFCVEREPVDKCISHFSMFKNSSFRKMQNVTWDSFVERRLFPRDHDKYTDFWGRLMVDRILKYETLEADLAKVAAERGFVLDGLKTKAKSGLREEVTVTPQQRRKIYRAFWKSRRHTGYRLQTA